MMIDTPPKPIRPKPHAPPSRTLGWVYVIVSGLLLPFISLPGVMACAYGLYVLTTPQPEEILSVIFTLFLSTTISAIIVLPTGIVGGIFLFLGLRHFQRDKALKTTGQLTQATITDRWTGYYKGKRYFIAYEYQADSPEGTPTYYQAAEKHDRDVPYQTGDSAPLRYLPNNPKICRLELDAHAPYSDS